MSHAEEQIVTMHILPLLRVVPEPFLYFKKALCKVKTSGQHLSFNIFW